VKEIVKKKKIRMRMLGQITKRNLISVASRCFSTMRRKEVLISQSRDLLSNTALEDWMAKNLNLQEKSVLILSNNITLNNTAEIKATLIDENTYLRTRSLIPWFCPLFPQTFHWPRFLILTNLRE